MTALWLYGYADGGDVGFRVLAAGEHPHFTSVNEFRATHRQALGNLFHQILQECMSAGLVNSGTWLSTAPK
jgi:hypothetical protein